MAAYDERSRSTAAPCADQPRKLTNRNLLLLPIRCVSDPALHGECLRNHNRPVRPIVCVLTVALALLLVGCGDDDTPLLRTWADSPSAEPSEYVEVIPEPAEPADGAVLYDDDWLLEDGVWVLSDHWNPRLYHDATSSNGLLMEGDPHTLWLMAPGLYGLYPTSVTFHASNPPRPRGCEDVVEAPLRVGKRGRTRFEGFETTSRWFRLGPGDFRVRLCATGLDEADGEPEFTRTGYHVSASRFRFQIWSAPLSPGRVVRTSSDFAREQHARVERAHARVTR